MTTQFHLVPKLRMSGATPPVLSYASKASMEQHYVLRVMVLPWRICSIIVSGFPISVKCRSCLINTKKAREQDKLINILLVILETARLKQTSYRYLNVSLSSLCRVCSKLFAPKILSKLFWEECRIACESSCKELTVCVQIYPMLTLGEKLCKNSLS
jgi:hypothetical protein